MKTLDRRRRLAVVAGGFAAMTGGLSGFIGRHHGSGDSVDNRFLLIGLSVGITVGIAIIVLVKMKGDDCS